MIKNITGHEPYTCPWSAFNDPECADVINSFKWHESGQISVRLGADPPAHLVHGLEIYHSALNAARADFVGRMKKKVGGK